MPALKMLRRLCFLVTTAAALDTTMPARLRAALSKPQISVMPCCYDGITARLVERAGFELTFMTGFGVAAARGYADAGLLSYGEMQDSARMIGAALKEIPFFADGDTGYGNAVNCKRTVKGYAQVGAAGVMIEDQVSPKRCGHTGVKAVVPRAEAVARVRAACDARDELGGGLVFIARTDANACLGFDEALARCQAFRDAGADVTFLEAPTSIEEMETYCREVGGWKLANMLEGGLTPVLPPAALQKMGYSIAAYPLTLLSAGTKASLEALGRLNRGTSAEDLLLPFGEICDIVGFTEYNAEAARYATDSEDVEAAPSSKNDDDEAFQRALRADRLTNEILGDM